MLYSRSDYNIIGTIQRVEVPMIIILYYCEEEKKRFACLDRQYLPTPGRWFRFLVLIRYHL